MPRYENLSPDPQWTSDHAHLNPVQEGVGAQIGTFQDLTESVLTRNTVDFKSGESLSQGKTPETAKPLNP